MSEPQKVAPQAPVDLVTDKSFRLCTTCPVEQPHGYFWKGNIKLPVMVIGRRGGRHLLQIMQEEHLISAPERAFLNAQLEVSSIPETWEEGGANDVMVVNHMFKKMKTSLEGVALMVLLAAALSSANEEPDELEPEPENQNL